jgi:outer membrane immunogenic protein
MIATDNPPPNPSAPTDYAMAGAIAASGSMPVGSSAAFIGGGQLGYNYQVGSFVGGIEADIQGIAGSKGSGSMSRLNRVFGNNTSNDNVAAVFSAQKSLDYLGTVRGRVGYLFLPNLLVYGTGGLAYGGINLNVGGVIGLAPTVPGFTTNGPGAGSYSGTQVGWTAGGGLEWMFMPNWSAKVEYLYYDLGTARTNVGVGSASLNAGGAEDGIKWSNATIATARINGNIVRAGVNYHFNFGGAAPVVAKY